MPQCTQLGISFQNNSVHMWNFIYANRLVSRPDGLFSLSRVSVMSNVSLLCLRAFLLQVFRAQTLKVTLTPPGLLHFHTQRKLGGIFFRLSLSQKQYAPVFGNVVPNPKGRRTALQSRQFFNKKMSAWILMHILAVTSQCYRYSCSAWEGGLRHSTDRTLSLFKMQ